MADQKTINELQESLYIDENTWFIIDNGVQTYKTKAPALFDWFNFALPRGGVRNLGLTATAATGALTLALKQNDGVNDLAATPTGKIYVLFRSLTQTLGGNLPVIFDAALSLVIPSGATLGYQSGADAKGYVYLYTDGTNKGLAVCSAIKDESQLHSLTAITTGADSNGFYADANRTNAAVKLIGFFQVNAISTAGTWTTPQTVYCTEFSKSATPYRMEVFTGSGTYYKKPNCKYIKVTVVGGGGGSGSTQTTVGGEAANGGCGGGGGYSIKTIINSSVGDSETVTVGPGGNGGSAGSNNATGGGTSSFGSHCSATGGGAGTRGDAVSASFNASGGDPGAGSGGDINGQGSSGMLGRVSSGSSHLTNMGGSSIFGGGLRVGATSSGSTPNNGYGNAGSAATSGASTSSRAGGGGFAGIVIVEEFY